MKRALGFAIAATVTFFPLAASADGSTSNQPTRADALKVLKLEEGVWDAVVEFPSKPGETPGTAHGVQTNTFVAGNGWIKNDFVVDAEYGGLGTWGFDSQKDKYVGIWVDSNQDYVRLDEGTFDAPSQTMTWRSEMRQPSPNPAAKLRMIEEFKGDVRVLTMTAIGAKSGKEVSLGKIVFTRRH